MPNVGHFILTRRKNRHLVYKTDNDKIILYICSCDNKSQTIRINFRINNLKKK